MDLVNSSLFILLILQMQFGQVKTIKEAFANQIVDLQFESLANGEVESGQSLQRCKNVAVVPFLRIL